jgi:hypothetical protein
MNRNRNWRDDRDVNRERERSRYTDYENYYPYPAMDDHYRMYRDWNDRAHYSRGDIETRPSDSGRTGYMEYDSNDDRSRTRISTYGYRNVGDRANYGHSGTNDPYDSRYNDYGRNMYGMGAGSYPNGQRDDIRYDSSDDWDMRGHRMDYDYSRSYRDERDNRVHYDAGMNERNRSTWTGDRDMQGRAWHDERRRLDDEERARRADGRNTRHEYDRSKMRGRW